MALAERHQKRIESPPLMDEAAARDKFRQVYASDREAGRRRRLEEYQRLFAGYEHVVASEFAALDAVDSELPREVEPWTDTPQEPAPRGEEPSPAADDAPRHLGPYRLIKKLGQGGQGLVFLAVDTRLGRNVALKTLGPNLDPSFAQRFYREAAAASRLDHPGICAVYEAGEIDGTHYIAMRYVGGASLAELIARSRKAIAQERFDSEPASVGATTRRGVDSTLQLIEKAARALHVAHEAGIVHRDIKPGNIMVDPAGEPVLLDFGLARDESSDLRTLTVAGDLMGTPAYMSPEQLTAHRIKLDRRTDVYSLGITLYECLTLQRPFEAPTFDALYAQILATDPPDPRRLNRHIPKDVKVVLETALEKDRDRRYASALDFAEDLRRARELEPIRAKPIGAVSRAWRWAQRRPGLAASMAGLFLALSAGLVITLTLLDVQRERTTEKTRFLAEAQHQRNEAENARKSAVEAKNAAEAQRQRAERALADREQALRRARAQALANASTGELRENPMLALLLAREAARIVPTPGVMGRLRDALHNSHERTAFLGHGAATEGAIHSGVNEAIFTPDGECVVTAGHDGTVRFWDLDGKQLRLLEGHRKGATTLVFSPFGTLLVSASSDDTARIWSNGKAVAVCKGHRPYYKRKKRSTTSVQSFPMRVVMSPKGDRIATTAQDSTIRIWDLEGTELAVIKGLATGMTFSAAQLRFSPDGEHLLTSHVANRHAILWSLDGREVRRYEHRSGVSDCDLSPDGTLVLTGCRDRTARLWKLDGTIEVELKGHTGAVTTVAFHAGGRLLLTASDDGTVRVWGPDGSTVVILRGDGKPLTGATFSPDGTRALAVTEDHRVLVWSLDSERLATLRGHTATVHSARFSADGETVLTASRDGTARLWSVLPSEGREITGSTQFVTTRRAGEKNARIGHARSRILDFRFARGSGDVFTLAGGGRAEFVRWPHTGSPMPIPVMTFGVGRFVVSPDASTFLAYTGMGASRGTGGYAELIECATGRVSHLQGHRSSVYTGAFAPNGEFAVTGSGDDTARVWNLGGNEIAVLEHGSAVSEIAISPDSRRILTGSSTGSVVYLWDISGQRVARLEHGSQVRSVAFSQDGSRILTAALDGRALVWDAEGRPLHRLIGHSGPVQCAVFDGSAQRVLTGSIDGTARIWQNDRTVKVLGGHSGWLTAITSDPASGRILTTTKDGSARLWSSEGEPLAVFRGNGPIKRAAFSDDGLRIAILTGDGILRIWLADSGSVVALADRRITREFHLAELERHLDLLGPEHERRVESARALKSAEHRKHAAIMLVQRLHLRLGMVSEMVAYLETTDEHHAEVKRLALELAREKKDHQVQLNSAAWRVVHAPGAPADEIARAIRLASEAVRRAPKAPSLRNTLGIALYRAGRYEDALRELAAATKGNRSKIYNPAADLAPRAMCLYRLGRKDEARKALTAALGQDAPNADTLALIKEAEQLLGN